MTTYTEPVTVSLTVLGPNFTSDGESGAIHVHASTCRDIGKSRYRAARAANMWTEDFSDIRDLVTTIYPEKDFQYNWDNPDERVIYEADVEVFDCVTWPEAGAVITVDVPDKPLDDGKPNVQDGAMTTKAAKSKSDPQETFVCDVCHHDLPVTKFPTVHRKDGIHRGTECRKCRDYRLEGRATGRPSTVVRPGAEPTSPAKPGYRGGSVAVSPVANAA